MKEILRRPLFYAGLFIRLVLVLGVSPPPVIEWYVPFLDVSTSSFTPDPWAEWIAQSGVSVAFPYGYVMWLAFLPLTILCKISSFPLTYGYGFTLVAADFSLFLVLRKMNPGQDRLLLGIYWLSPIVIVATYLLGFNDLIPVLLLAISLCCIRQSRFVLSGFTCIAAISAKLSMVLALPFFLIYLLHNRSLRHYLPQLIEGMVFGIVLMVLPFLFSLAGMNMLFGNPEMEKVYQLAFDLDGGAKVYVVPLAYLLMLYGAWQVKRLNFELFHALLGLVFLLVVLMTPASPGWFVWPIPLLIMYQTKSDRIAISLTAIWSTLYVLDVLFPIVSNEVLVSLQDVRNVLQFPAEIDDRFASLVHTAMVATGIVLALRIWRETISRNDYFRLSRKPFIIGIAGDSSSGKDTLSNALEGLFGSHSVSTLSGDDYHLWDREKPMWRVMTHLNPMVNDLERFACDLVALTDGKSIQSRYYNHQTGRMGRPRITQSNDFIIASGLHTLYLPILRECYDLSVYLDIDEGLRRHFKLHRDVQQRNHNVEQILSSFERREQDSERFIRHQSSYAGLVLSLQPIHPHMLKEDDGNSSLRFKLVSRSRHGLKERTLMRVLVGVCGLHVDIAASSDASGVELTIEGETSALDIELAAKIVCPRIFEFLDVEPKWQDGITGLMQLIVLSQIDQLLTKRLIW